MRAPRHRSTFDEMVTLMARKALNCQKITPMEANQEAGQTGKAEKFFTDFGKKLDKFLVEVKDAGNRAEADAQKKYQELKEAAERLKREAQNKERWKEVEDGLTRAGEEMERAFKAAFKKKEQGPK
jgi:lysyl-tRNA synthetase class I